MQFLEPKSGQVNQNNGAKGQPQTNNQQTNQSNYTKVDEDPFSNSSGPVEVSDDELPF